jgi:glycine/D-amino acid oxidase-like deaminating enzyme
LHDRSEVLNWTKTDAGVHDLQTAGGSLRARRVIFATNGFMPEQLNAEFYARTLPVVSAILVTRPLDREERAAQGWHTPDPAINSRLVLNYYRLLPDNRFLFGGRGHTRGHVQGERETYRSLANTMRHMLPEWSDVDIEYQWHGLICYTRSLRPSLGQLDEDPSVYFGFGYHGNGVNTATWTGKQLADWIGAGRAPPLPAIVKGLGGRFRPASLRLQMLQLGIKMSTWLDRRS